MAGSNAVARVSKSKEQKEQEVGNASLGFRPSRLSVPPTRIASFPRPASQPMTPVDSQRIPLLLLVGDCVGLGPTLAGMLRTRYRVMLARSVDEGFNMLQGRVPDLVMTEFLPGQHAHPQLWFGGKDGLDVPLLYLTDPVHLQSDWEQLGIDGTEFVTTPIIPHVLFARVRTLLRVKRQADMLREVARLDATTLLANRERFEVQLELEWRACQRDKMHLGLVLLSVDHFQSFVRRSGQQAGEEAMQALAEVLDDALRRPRDFVARYSRDEFVVLLPGYDEEAALLSASYLCNKVTVARLPYCGDGISATMSISAGAASAIPESISNPRRLLKAADDHLYIAMMSGRNQARSSSQSTKPPLSGQRPRR